MVFRSMTSVVSAVSGFVAYGHRTMHHDSCSPSKIPYVGFSPVRLQTGIGPRPSMSAARLKREARIRDVRLKPYTRLMPPSQAPVVPLNGGAFVLLGGTLLRRPSSPEALGSPAGYAVPLDQCLLWPHPRLSPPPAALSSSSVGSSPCGLVWAGCESFPTLLRVSFPSCRLPYPGRPNGCFWLFLHRQLWPSPHSYRLGICTPTHAGSHVVA
jgi:hypothetical protein